MNILNALLLDLLLLRRGLKELTSSDPQFIHLLETEPLYINWKVSVSLHFKSIQAGIGNGLNILLPKLVV